MYNYQQLQQLAWFKRQALMAGKRGLLFSNFRINSKLTDTDFSEGQYIEVVMSWMLGYFCFVTKTSMFIDVSAKLDSEGIDFKLRGAEHATINLKFNKPSESDVADTDDRCDWCVRVWPSPEVRHAPEPKKRQTGSEAIADVLSTVYKISTISISSAISR